MMSETIDDVLDDDEAEDETDELTNQVSFIKFLFLARMIMGVFECLF